ncbi:hypothetical protein F8M41_002698 [Gigaspora margarita]|uniref:Uncharacterized protein n=1 Tax=Gigaspora margarita TaxID=4874 RepID=A0A8H4AYJ0_GIGMA|nr:hypothetical protein F8M41_002698 [Gigaspora margarita]
MESYKLKASLYKIIINEGLLEIQSRNVNKKSKKENSDDCFTDDNKTNKEEDFSNYDSSQEKKKKIRIDQIITQFHSSNSQRYKTQSVIPVTFSIQVIEFGNNLDSIQKGLLD